MKSSYLQCMYYLFINYLVHLNAVFSNIWDREEILPLQRQHPEKMEIPKNRIEACGAEKAECKIPRYIAAILTNSTINAIAVRCSPVS